jgi:hypothetical protein
MNNQNTFWMFLTYLYDVDNRWYDSTYEQDVWRIAACITTISKRKQKKLNETTVQLSTEGF